MEQFSNHSAVSQCKVVRMEEEKYFIVFDFSHDVDLFEG